jgi:hypothetical protein
MSRRAIFSPVATRTNIVASIDKNKECGVIIVILSTETTVTLLRLIRAADMKASGDCYNLEEKKPGPAASSPCTTSR